MPVRGELMSRRRSGRRGVRIIVCLGIFHSNWNSIISFCVRVYTNTNKTGLDKTIQALPSSWDDETQSQRAPEKSKKYEELHSKLLELQQRRKEALEKVEKYKALKELLKPFEEPKSMVQPNLVTKDGELGRELDRMRILMARVGGRIQGLEEGRGREEDEMDLDGVGEEEKLKGILEMMR